MAGTWGHLHVSKKEERGRARLTDSFLLFLFLLINMQLNLFLHTQSDTFLDNYFLGWDSCFRKKLDLRSLLAPKFYTKFSF